MTTTEIPASTPEQLLLAPLGYSYLKDDLYVSTLAAWVLDNQDQSEFIQHTIEPGLDALSLTGYEVLWQKLHTLPGWEDVLWAGIGRRKHPVEDCVALTTKCSGAESVAKMYEWLYSCLRERGEAPALILSQRVAIQAAHHALSGIWKDSDLLMRKIFSYHRGELFLVDGKLNWWEATANILEETMERALRTNYAVMKSGLLDGVVEKYVGVLVSNHYPAGWEKQDCGQIFMRAAKIGEETYLPLLFAWMSAGGDWRGLWDLGDETTQGLLFRHPLVRREKLNEHIVGKSELLALDERPEL